MDYSTIRETVVNFLNEKNYTAVEEFFLEKAMENRDDIELLYTITNEVRKRANGASRAAELLTILLPEYEKSGNWQAIITIGKKIHEYFSRCQSQRPFMKKAYQALHPDIANFEEFIQNSRLEDEEFPLPDALTRLDRYLKYRPGSLYYFERFGIGIIREIRFSLDKMIIDFEKQPNYSLEFKIADNILVPVPDDHFLALRYRRIDELQAMIRNQPMDALHLLLKSEKRGLSAQEIKRFFIGLLEDAEWDRFWKKSSKLAEKDPHISISIARPRIYEYVEAEESIDRNLIAQFSGSDWQKKIDVYNKAIVNNPATKEEFLRQLIGIAQQEYEKDSIIALEIAFALGAKMPSSESRKITSHFLGDPEMVVIAIPKMQLSESKAKTIEYIRKNFNDWMTLYVRLFFSLDDHRYYDIIANELKRADQEEILRGIIDDSIKSYGKNPSQFLWFCRRAFLQEDYQSYLNADLLYRLFEMIVFFNDPLIWKKGVSFLTSNNFLFVERCLAGARIEEAQKVLDFLKAMAKLDDYQKKEIVNIIQHRYPSLFKKEEDTTFFALHSTIVRKQGELEDLVKRQIPENAKEIGRAADYGDLRENFEYKSAKDRQQLLITKAGNLDLDLKRVRSINFDLIHANMTGIGTQIILKHLQTGQEKTITILGPWEADQDRNIYSYLSLFVQKIIGKKQGEKLLLDSEMYEVIQINKVIEDDYRIS
ncbi:MAG: GreA/GreB family elongation factor [Candidatus Delongbacteria bacterium]|nr:GreA/GreB family elongation factor [Candidatus Delongbacteria bacterium]